jgi:hypothetical protein
MPMEPGTYTVTGGNVEADYEMAATASSYAISGQAVALKRGYTLAMTSGSYGVNAQAVQLVRSITMPLEAGAYTINGQPVQLVYSTAKSIFLAAGSYVFAGNDLAIRRNYVLTCGTGSYALAGQELSITYTETQHYIVPYLIGATEDSARTMIEQIHGIADVIGSGGTVVSQFPDFMQTVLKGQVVTITMGGPVNYSRRGRRRGLPPYHCGSQR